MKKFFLATALSCGLLVSSCTTVPGVDPITGNPIATEVTNIQALAVQICSFEPTAATVTAILATFVPGAAPVTAIINQVAQSICGAVAPKAFRLGSARVAMVNGVPINGSFVSHRKGMRRGGTVNGVVVDGHFVGQ